MEVKTLILGELQTNCYLIINDKSKSVMIVDPATDFNNEIDEVILKNQLKPVAVLLTHGHFDHIGSVGYLKNKYNVPIYASKYENDLMSNSALNLSKSFLNMSITGEADIIIKDNAVIELDGISIRCIEVPGHTEESICYYIEAENLLFSGDTLFRNSVGRSDFYNGPSNTLQEKIKEKLLVLPEETNVFPGHGFATTIEEEKRNNSYLR
ncbi:glyoxylase-like metal-dependent hydrolase (beta-lactamase superfamily II) [Natranaerovirga pectinivora]|uniref:Glyoxylase-like metal-dependent hydrolase (Beta-lactamase superfamily II) n=1 Tax=Natranaerovirga pectinivora TaxID=682400 RepID=A0A4R3MPS6_9FIRM|nr:MBL fold metallo-hydrolase [Natranaerovirga pectinivora]TCT16784.1 glyoxylase-like metal-dependent hydrolase (beta-lactamase superfamily II) [Natranaerovirga pectinivora]